MFGLSKLRGDKQSRAKCLLLKMVIPAIMLFFTAACSEHRRELTAEEALRQHLGVKSQIKWTNNVVNQIRFFNDKGLKIQERWQSPQGLIVTSRKLEYGEKCLLLLRTEWFKGEQVPKSHYVYHYTPQGQLVKEEWLTPFDEIQTVTEYFYEADRLIREIVKGGRDNQLYEKEYSYENGHRTGFIERDTRGDVTNRQVYEYDNEGRIIKELWFKRGDEPVITKVYGYTEGKLATEKQYSQDGVLEHQLVREYDTQGLLIFERWLDEAENTLTENRYTYGY